MMTFNERMGTQGKMALVHANCCCVAYEAGQQSQQVKVEQLKNQLKSAGYTDKGGELMKPRVGNQPRFDLLDDLKNSLSELAQKYRAEAHELSRIRDFEKSQMCSHFANELDRLNKGGAQ